MVDEDNEELADDETLAEELPEGNELGDSDALPEADADMVSIDVWEGVDAAVFVLVAVVVTVPVERGDWDRDAVDVLEILAVAETDIDPVDVRETDTDLDTVGDPEFVLDVVVVAVEVVDCVDVLVELIVPEPLAVPEFECDCRKLPVVVLVVETDDVDVGEEE